MNESITKHDILIWMAIVFIALAMLTNVIWFLTDIGALLFLVEAVFMTLGIICFAILGKRVEAQVKKKKQR